MEFGREAFRVPGNGTQEVSFAPNLLIKQGAKPVSNGRRRDRRAANAGKSGFTAS
jgi:predicted Rossmann fold nucleotide-binding protein DprA/Smf involved in DNA uptake